MQIEMKTIEDLCTYIDVTPGFLKYVLFEKENNYYSFKILKRNGDYRTITAPKEELKYIQLQLLKFLERNYSFLECQHGFIKGRSNVTNAKCHINKRYVLNGDIKEFFDNIHFGRVRGLFMNKPFNYSSLVATFIAKIVCYDKKLPQGAPTSPIISNIICYTIDRELDFLAKKNNCRYTRYADDITFSTDSESFPQEIAEIKDGKVYFSDRVIKTINGGFNNGFQINNKKTKLYKRFVRQEVTGIVVNRKTNVDSNYIRRIRAILHNITKYGFLNTYNKTFKRNDLDENAARKKLFHYLCGKISYLKMVKGDVDGLYLKYANEFNKVFKTNTFDITDEVRVRKYAEKRCYAIECGCSTGTGFSIENNIAVTSTHVISDSILSLITNKENPEYENQFPIDGSKYELIKLCHNDEKNTRIVTDYNITKENFENDIISLSARLNNKLKMNLAKRKAQTGDIVYLIGYPAFNGFDKTSLHIEKAIVTGENVLLGRKIINTDKIPQHGMSGGPVLNEKKEVVGIVYAGNEFDNNENVGFISLL